MDDFEDVVVVENWFCPFGAEKTTLKTLLEAAEKAVFFIVVVFKASLLREEEEEDDKEVDEIAWGFMFAFVRVSFLSFGEKKKKFLCGCRKTKKKRRERFLREKTFLSSKKVAKGRAFFFLARERKQISSQKRGALVRR